MDPATIAAEIAAAVRERIATEEVNGGLISLTEHPHREALGHAMRAGGAQEQELLHEMYLALRPIAEEIRFVDIHIWTDGPSMLSITREKILSYAV